MTHVDEPHVDENRHFRYNLSTTDLFSGNQHKLQSVSARTSPNKSYDQLNQKAYSSFSTRGNNTLPRKKLYCKTSCKALLSSRGLAEAHPSNAPFWKWDLDFSRQIKLEDRLSKLLSDKSRFTEYSVTVFEKYDTDLKRCLTFSQVKSFIQGLTHALEIPQLSDEAMIQIFNKYTKTDLNSVTLVEFQEMYWDLLKTIKKVFYSSNVTSVSRSALICHTMLYGDQSIYNVYSFEKKIGSGAFGEVFLVRDLCVSSRRVCKVINLQKNQVPLDQIKAEIIALKKLDHPNIVKILEVVQQESAIYIVMEFCEGGELATCLQQTVAEGRVLTEPYVIEIMQQLLEAVNYFHSKLVVHKDLKPENVLFLNKEPDGPIKIIDFGLAEFFTKQLASSKCIAGTCHYMAPEMFSFSVTLKSDIWSLGCILFQMLAGELPFKGSTFEAVQHRIIHCEPNYSLFSKRPMSDHAVDLIRKMLNKNPYERLSAKECLKHAWLRPSSIPIRCLSSRSIRSLKGFSELPIVKRIFLNMLTHLQGVSMSYLHDVNNSFRTLDRQRNGCLSKHDLAIGFVHGSISGHEINDILHTLDIDESGNVTYTEFLTGCSWSSSIFNVGYIKLLFTKMDTKNEGKLAYQQVIDFLTQKSSDMFMSEQRSMLHDSSTNNRELYDLVKAIDILGDGFIDLDDLLTYMVSSW